MCQWNKKVKLSFISIYSRSLLSILKSLPLDSDIGTYGAMLESMCQWNKVDDVLALINDWLHAALKVPEVENTPSGKVSTYHMFLGFYEKLWN